jgi:hypothetical protein
MSVEQTLFETYQGFDIQDTVEACKVTQANLRALEELTGGQLCEFTTTDGESLDNGERYLWLPNDPNKEYVACPGDYLMQDLAGHYLVIPREIFEKRYAKRV